MTDPLTRLLHPTPMSLGCASEYDVFITMNDRITLQPEIVDRVEWSDLEWERALDDISTASVTLPDVGGGVRCCAGLGGLVPWRFGLRIERDSQLVWQGPVITITRPTNDGRAASHLRVTANDVFSRFKRRLHTRFTEDFTVDAAELMYAIMMRTARLGAERDGFVMYCPSAIAGTTITRTLIARDFEYAWDVLLELFTNAVDGYVLGADVVVFEPGTGWVYSDGTEEHLLLEGPYDPDSGELVYGTFTNESWIERPGWSISGWNQVNTSWVPGADAGQEGFRRVFTAENTEAVVIDGVLDFVDPNPLYRASPDEETVIADAVYQRRADSIVAQRAVAPAVIEGGQLAQTAPICMEHLRPGSLWAVDIHDACYTQLLQQARLKRVTVNVNKSAAGLDERVSPTLFPVGFTEADI
jgi:hypothetical protein